MHTLSHFFAEDVYTPEFSHKNFLKFFTTNLQHHSLKVSSKRNLFECNFDDKHLFIKMSQKKTYKPYKAIMYW